MKKIRLKDVPSVLCGKLILLLASVVAGLIISPLMSLADVALPRTSKIPDLLTDLLYSIWELDTTYGIPLRNPQNKKLK